MTPIPLPNTFYQSFLSDAARKRVPNRIRYLLPFESRPGVISLLAGKPNTEMFPFTSFSFAVTDPLGQSEDTVLKLDGPALDRALQYGPTAGQGHFVDLLIGLQEFSHGRKRGEGWSLAVGSGSQDVISKAFVALLNPGDDVFIETPVYADAIACLQGMECNLIGIKTDADGIRSSDLRQILENWETGKPKPKVLYTVPYGCNPTGMTSTLERRKEVLELAREHNFLILEDDPYFYLYYGNAPRPPSYFSLELQEPEVGRVIRFDSFSKVLSAGIRIGFASGPTPLIEAINMHSSTTTLQTSSLTQEIAYALLTHWGYEGLKKHTERAAEFYRRRRDNFEKSMNKHLHGLAEWTRPEAGMFFWFKLLLPPSRSADFDVEDYVVSKVLENGVLAMPGDPFLPSGEKTSYIRASFSLNSDEEIDEALRRLAEVVRSDLKE